MRDHSEIDTTVWSIGNESVQISVRRGESRDSREKDDVANVVRKWRSIETTYKCLILTKSDK